MARKRVVVASKLPGHQDEHEAVILGPRNDGGVYSGILTYQASKPVKVIVWNLVNLDNKTAIPKEFGSQKDMIKTRKGYRLTDNFRII